MGTVVVQQSPIWNPPTFGVVGLASAQIIPFNVARVCATVVNDSSVPVYIGIGAPAVVGSGILLVAGGGSLQIGGPGGISLTSQAIFAINGILALANVTIHEAI